LESDRGATRNANDVLLPWFRIYYNDVYRVDLPPNHRFPMEKYRLVREMLQAKIFQSEEDDPPSNDDNDSSNPSGGEGGKRRVECEFLVSPLATVDELTTTHDPRYVDRFVRGLQSPEEVRAVGFPWSPRGVDRALSSTGGTVAAARGAVEETLRRRQEERPPRGPPPPPCWAAHVAGGTHHAFRDRGEGFCVFSDIAVAANVVRRRYGEQVRRILVVDLDVHQGNGNAALFRDRPDVFTFSMHCSSNYFSPPEESDVDVELPPGCGDDAYLATLRRWLRHLRKEHDDGQNFDLVFYQAGVDVLECDRLGQLSLSPKGAEERNRLVYDFCLGLGAPLVITMGGGYPRHQDEWGPILEAHCGVYWQAHQALARAAK
jgi:acetoin utilization deacetylase AcuC-like enzyme